MSVTRTGSAAGRDRFSAVVMEESATPNAAGVLISAGVRELDRAFLLPGGLPPGEVLVEVAYSGLNYKEAIIFSGQRGGALGLPLVMGIDGVGTVVESAHSDWHPGDAVIANGGGLGDLRHGAIARLAAVPGDILVRLPEGMLPRTAGGLGTAGFTAALSVDALVRGGVDPASGPVLVTGASGGVGVIAVMLLARAGYETVALTGRAEANGAMLRGLGAAELLNRSELEGELAALQTECWAGVVDTVAGPILANALAQTRYGGVATCCGLAASRELTTSIMPFILRGVSLVGINSVDCPRGLRVSAWDRLARDIDVERLETVTREFSMAEVPVQVLRFLDGAVKGRVRIRI